jgi:hypothetical protein
VEASSCRVAAAETPPDPDLARAARHRAPAVSSPLPARQTGVRTLARKGGRRRDRSTIGQRWSVTSPVVACRRRGHDPDGDDHDRCSHRKKAAARGRGGRFDRGARREMDKPGRPAREIRGCIVSPPAFICRRPLSSFHARRSLIFPGILWCVLRGGGGGGGGPQN